VKPIFLLILLAWALTACSALENLTGGSTVQDAPPAVEDADTGSTTQDSTPVTAVERPVWQTLPLVDARTGEAFAFADFAGKTIFVEPMATWCTNCRQQLANVRAAREQLNSDEVVFIGLSVEVGLDNVTLAEYQQTNNYDWTFAVVTQEMLAELVGVFGRTVTNPPSTPHFIIRPDGSATGLATGIESANAIVAEIRAEGGL
jgi:hypothetical protein